jgi:putative ABC transport system permease protein
MAITADGRSNQYYGFHLPWLGFLAAVVFAVLIGWIASLLPARTTSRFDVVAALRGARKPPAPSTRRPVVGLVMLLGGIGLTLVGGILLAILTEAGRNMPYGHPLQWIPIVMLIIGPILAQLGLVLCGPLLLRVVARVLRRSGLGARLAARDSARNPGRAVPALAAIMTTVFVAVFGMCIAAGGEVSSRANYQYAMPLGTVQVPLVTVDFDSIGMPSPTPYPHPAAVETAIRDSVHVDRMQRLATVPDWIPGTDPAQAVAEEVAIPVISPEYLCPGDSASPDYDNGLDLTTAEGRDVLLNDWRCQGYYLQMFGIGTGHLFVSDASGLELALGRKPSTEALRTLADGGAVSLYRQYVKDHSFSISWWTPTQANEIHSPQGPGTPLRTETLDAVVELPEQPYNFGVFITKATADRLGLDYEASMVLASTKTMPTTQERDALYQAISDLPDNDGSMGTNIETGPADFAGPWVWGLLGLAGLIAIASSAVAIGLARFDGRQDDATLSALGAGRLVRKNFAFWQAIVIAGLGSVLGAATGLVPAWALGAVGLPFAPPWLPIGITVVALPLVIACGSWLLATRSKVSARRVAIA